MSISHGKREVPIRIIPSIFSIWLNILNNWPLYSPLLPIKSVILSKKLQLAFFEWQNRLNYRGNNLSSKDIEKKLPFNFCSSVAAALTKRLFPVPICPYKSIVFHGARLPSNN